MLINSQGLTIYLGGSMDLPGRGTRIYFANEMGVGEVRSMRDQMAGRGGMREYRKRQLEEKEKKNNNNTQLLALCNCGQQDVNEKVTLK